ncbi:MAG: TraR/DksA C4-type zinc finger protein [Halioglobus sp.]|nr:TraR/DksA C4-type zinc finger protein [Halioglobus sp.]
MRPRAADRHNCRKSTAPCGYPAGDYGYCFVCGEEISPARLNFDAATTRCMGCVES